MNEYKGSLISFLSSQLFLIASLFNYYRWNNYIEGITILLLYFTSILYHSSGNIYLRNVDMAITKLTVLVCGIMSLLKKNILPIIFVILVTFFYYANTSATPFYHSMFIHFPGFVGFMMLYFNSINN